MAGNMSEVYQRVLEAAGIHTDDWDEFVAKDETIQDADF